jgi:D-serine deaminase-like pyridoxal phosphate-dependent protein
MKTITLLPAGVRLDGWPEVTTPQPPQDAPEVAQLREELRKSMPHLSCVLDMLAQLRPLRDLAGRLAAPQPVKVKTQKS